MRKLGWFVAAFSGAAALGMWACGGDDSNSVFDGGNGSDTGNGNDATVSDGGGDGCVGPFCSFEGSIPDSGVCSNLCLKQMTCPNAADGAAVTTTISGTVYDPADQVPLYNVAVYVPNAALSPIVHGATCDQCGATLSGSPLVSTLTDYTGHFVLQNVPVTTNVPLVMQVGKWRRRINIANVSACVDNPITDKTMTRLATKPMETSPDDDIPQIALTTGGADALECLPLKIGIDVGQFTTVAGGGRVNIYQGNGGSQLTGGSVSATNFWADNGAMGTNPLVDYDMVMLGCEGNTYPNEKPLAALQAMQSYANVGGRVFGTHYHYYWIESSPQPWPITATFDHQGDPGNQTNWPVLIDQDVPEGPRVRAVDARERRKHDARHLHQRRSTSRRRRGQSTPDERPGLDALGLHEPRDALAEQPEARRVLLVQHAGVRRRRAGWWPTMRQGRLLRPPRRVGQQSRRDVPGQLRSDRRPHGAREGARVLAVRSLVVCAE